MNTAATMASARSLHLVGIGTPLLLVAMLAMMVLPLPPFLLDMFALPNDTFQLFVATSVFNARFGTLVQTMHMLVLTLLTTAAIQGRLVFRWPVVLRYGAATIVIVLGMIAGSRALYALVVDTSYRKNEIIGRMEIQGPTVPVTGSGAGRRSACDQNPGPLSLRLTRVGEPGTCYWPPSARPAPAWISTRSPFFNPAWSNNACQAVSPARGTAAASL